MGFTRSREGSLGIDLAAEQHDEVIASVAECANRFTVVVAMDESSCCADLLSGKGYRIRVRNWERLLLGS